MAAEPPLQPTASFGSRFVDELFRVTGSRAHFNYEVIQELRRSDREQTIALLRARAQLDSRAIARLQSEEPETVARELGTAIQSAQNAAAMGMGWGMSVEAGLSILGALLAS
jgi:hypothetical protein